MTMIEIRPGAAIGDGRYRLERLLGAGGMARYGSHATTGSIVSWRSR